MGCTLLLAVVGPKTTTETGFGVQQHTTNFSTPQQGSIELDRAAEQKPIGPLSKGVPKSKANMAALETMGLLELAGGPDKDPMEHQGASRRPRSRAHGPLE